MLFTFGAILKKMKKKIFFFLIFILNKEGFNVKHFLNKTIFTFFFFFISTYTYQPKILSKQVSK